MLAYVQDNQHLCMPPPIYYQKWNDAICCESTVKEVQYGENRQVFDASFSTSSELHPPESNIKRKITQNKANGTMT